MLLVSAGDVVSPGGPRLTPCFGCKPSRERPGMPAERYGYARSGAALDGLRRDAPAWRWRQAECGRGTLRR
jgi:hypothetical protein